MGHPSMGVTHMLQNVLNATHVHHERGTDQAALVRLFTGAVKELDTSSISSEFLPGDHREILQKNAIFPFEKVIQTSLNLDSRFDSSTDMESRITGRGVELKTSRPRSKGYVLQAVNALAGSERGRDTGQLCQVDRSDLLVAFLIDDAHSIEGTSLVVVFGTTVVPETSRYLDREPREGWQRMLSTQKVRDFNAYQDLNLTVRFNKTVVANLVNNLGFGHFLRPELLDTVVREDTIGAKVARNFFDVSVEGGFAVITAD